MNEASKRGLSIGTKLSLGALILVSVVALLATFVLTDREFGEWAMTRWPALSEAVLSAHRSA